MKLKKKKKRYVLLFTTVIICVLYIGLTNTGDTTDLACIISLEKIDKTKYKQHRIPMRLVFHNSNSKIIKILNPISQNRFISNIVIRCYDKNNKNVSGHYSSISLPQNLKKIQYKYIEILPNKKYKITLDLSKLLAIPLKPGKYQVKLQYENKLGKDCVKKFLIKNTLSINIAPPDNLMKPSYISQKKALEIAKKANGMKYDKSKPIKISLDEGIYTIIFPNNLPKGYFGSNYAAIITIDAKSGRVLKSIAAP